MSDFGLHCLPYRTISRLQWIEEQPKTYRAECVLGHYVVQRRDGQYYWGFAFRTNNYEDCGVFKCRYAWLGKYLAKQHWKRWSEEEPVT